jgi:hypothetical protein
MTTSAPTNPSTDEQVDWVAGYIMDFADGNDSEARVLVTGSLEKCEHFRNLLPGLAYSGTRPIKGAQSFVMSKSDWETL